MLKYSYSVLSTLIMTLNYHPYDNQLRYTRHERNRVNKLVKKAMKTYIYDNLEKHRNNSKNFWKHIKEVIPDNKSMASNISLIDSNSSLPIPEAELPNYINSFFYRHRVQISQIL